MTTWLQSGSHIQFRAIGRSGTLSKIQRESGRYRTALRADAKESFDLVFDGEIPQRRQLLQCVTALEVAALFGQSWPQEFIVGTGGSRVRAIVHVRSIERWQIPAAVV